MARNLSDKVSDAGKSIVDAAQKLGHDIAEGTQKAVQSVSEMATGEGKTWAQPQFVSTCKSMHRAAR